MRFPLYLCDYAVESKVKQYPVSQGGLYKEKEEINRFGPLFTISFKIKNRQTFNYYNFSRLFVKKTAIGQIDEIVKGDI